METASIRNGAFHITGKSHGLENAALRHERNAHRSQLDAEQDSVNLSDQSRQAAPVSSSPIANQPVHAGDENVRTKAPGTYDENGVLVVASGTQSKIETRTATADTDGVIAVGDGAKVALNTHVGVDNGDDTLLVGKNADVKINSHVGVDNSDDVIIVGEGAKLSLNSHVGVDNGNDTLIIGPDAEVKINSHVDTANGNDTVVVDQGARLKVNYHADIDNGNDRMYVAEGAEVRINAHIGDEHDKMHLTGDNPVYSFERFDAAPLLNRLFAQFEPRPEAVDSGIMKLGDARNTHLMQYVEELLTRFSGSAAEARDVIEQKGGSGQWFTGHFDRFA